MMGQFYLEAASECKAEKSFLQLGMVPRDLPARDLPANFFARAEPGAVS